MNHECAGEHRISHVACAVSAPDFNNLIGRQLGGMSLIWRSINAALCSAIIKIVLRCAEKQMIWITARWIVAVVASIHFATQGKDINLIVDCECNSVGRRLSFIFNHHLAVSMGVNCSLPRPTFIGPTFINFGPKSCLKFLKKTMGWIAATFVAAFHKYSQAWKIGHAQPISDSVSNTIGIYSPPVYSRPCLTLIEWPRPIPAFIWTSLVNKLQKIIERNWIFHRDNFGEISLFGQA